MNLVVREIMQRNVRTVGLDVTLPELEQAFLEAGVSGFPVVDRDELVGIVSRSDIVRQLYHEHELAESTSDFYSDSSGFHEVPLVSFKQIADRVGERIEQLRVKDVMSRTLLKVARDQPLRQVAQLMADNHVHRVLVTEEDRLLGLVSSLDLVALIANGRLTAKP